MRALLQVWRWRWTLLALAGCTCWAQTTLSLASGTAVAGGTVALGLTFNDPGSTNQVAGLQWTFQYPAANITAITVSPAAGLTAASKTITCAAKAGMYTCVATGPNDNVIANGLVVTAQFTLAAKAVSTNIALSNALAASAPANSVSVAAAGGTISVLPTLASLTCNPAALSSAGVSICSAVISQAAPSGGAVVGLSSNNTLLGTPASLSVAAGATAATVSLTAGTISAAQTAVLTATLNGSSKAVSFTLSPPANSGSVSTASVSGSASLASLTCTPTTLSSAGTSTCSAVLSQAAPAGGAAINLSSNNTLLGTPAFLTVAAGATTATVSLTAGTVSATQTAILTATLNGSSATASFTLNPPLALSSLTCNPAALNSAAVGTCSAVLSQAAPAGGTAIGLSSNNTLLGTPAFLTVAAGATTAAVSLTAGAISAAQTAVLTATLNGSSKTVSFTLNPPANSGSVPSSATLASLTCNPTTLGPGGGTTCIAVLSQAAPAGGAVIGLSSNNEFLWPPPSLAVAAGATDAAVGLSAGTVFTTQTAVLAATLNGSSKTSSFTLNPAATLASLTCTPTTLTSGNLSTCIAGLSQAAPAGGAVVSLSSNNEMLLTPASLTVAAGANFFAVAVTAGAISTAQTAVLTATLNGSSLANTFTLNPPATLASLTCNPTTLSSGNASTCSTVLSQAAPAGGVAIGLSSNNALLETPASLSVAAGATTATVSLTAGTISTVQTAVLTVSKRLF